MKNESGVNPVENKCVVLPDVVPEKTAGGIIRAPITVERENYKAVKALLIAVGGNAFEDWKPPIPEPGQRIYVAVAAGIIHTGVDERKYRIVLDRDIAGILTEETEETKEKENA